MSLQSISTRMLRQALSAVVAMLAILALTCAAGSGAQAQTALERLVSPGKLSEAHLKEEADCASCHASFKKQEQTRLCLDCHKDVKADVNAATGFHGRSPQVKDVECKTCHTEHKGREADIINFQTDGFNHDLTDYPLRGGHVGKACKECHAPDRKWSQAPQQCDACHGGAKDPHKGGLGQDCASCHNEKRWAEVRFDHSQTDFLLAGAHATTKCLSCHVNQVWKDLPATCWDCHAKDDKHKGAFGKDCKSCHTVADWKEAKFDHDKTGFRLEGAHEAARCEACHGVGKPDPAPRTCIGCHRADDKHKGANGAACADCHVTRNWKTVTFNHDRTGFPLRGAHGRKACADCHVKPATEVKLPTDCIGCHLGDDTHKGLLGPACLTCHDEASWSNIRFDHRKDTGFALLGKHADATCAACHKTPTPQGSPAPRCIACHAEDDPHKGQLGDGCGSCHGVTDWKTEIRFDHDFTEFPLLGKHAAVACNECHATRAYLDASTDCASCHRDDDVHKGGLGANCGECHNPRGWRFWTFDHDTQTDFALTGKHRGLTCAACHTDGTHDLSGLGTRCVSCHASDDKHRGAFGSNCERCHNTEAFWAVEIAR